jgi:hypothetical protein
VQIFVAYFHFASLFFTFLQRKSKSEEREKEPLQRKSRSEEGEKESGSDSHRYPILMNEVPIAPYWA